MRIISFYIELRIALYFAGTKATSADVNPFYFAVYDGTYSLDIGLPRSLCFQVGMTDVHTAHSTFAANFTIICHDYTPPCSVTVQHWNHITKSESRQVFDPFSSCFSVQEYGTIETKK